MLCGIVKCSSSLSLTPRAISLLVARRCASSQTQSLVSCQQLASVIDNNSNKNNNNTCRVLDATWDLKVRDYSEDHFKCRIPGSKFFDLEVCRDVSSPYKMMLPSPQLFEDYVSELGISSEDHVVIYDNHATHAIFSSPRLWWMFHVFGHTNVSILNGGLTAWLQQGFPHASGPYSQHEILPKRDGKFSAVFNKDLVRDYDFVKENATASQPVQLLESRGLGTLPHTEDGEVDLKSSSVPCATWSPFNLLLNTDTRSVKTPDEIRDFFSTNEIDLSSQPVTTCGRGVSASIVTFCAYYASGALLPVYDGSWSEWSARM